MSTEHTAPGTAPETVRPIRWLSGILLVCIWIVLQGGALWYVGDDATYQIMSVLYISPAMAFLVLLWFLCWSLFSAVVRFRTLAVLLSIVGGFFACMRHEGYTGEMIPIFVPRWHPSAEQRTQEYLEQASRTAASAPVSTDGVDASSSTEPAELVAMADDWPQFRGPLRDGVVVGANIRQDWKAKPPQVIWRHPVGKGWSSFAIVGNRLFTQEQRGAEEAVVCYDADTGKQIWVHTDTAHFQSALGGEGPRGTPTVHDSRVYALGATGKLNCLDAVAGTLLWSHDILTDAQAENLAWGMAGSPWVDQGRVIVAPGGGQGQSVRAYATTDGRLLWSQGDHPASYAAIRQEVLDGKQQLLLFDGQGLAGLNPENGREFWRLPWQNAPQINVAQPMIHDGKVLISSGYGLGSALLDVSQVSEAGVPQAVWQTPNRFKLKFNDGIYHKGQVYGLDEGILACIDASSGKRLWKRGRYGYGQLLLAGETLIVMAETGVVALVAAESKGYRELARFRALDGLTWNHPVLHRGRLFVRNSVEAACYDVAGDAAVAGTEPTAPQNTDQTEPAPAP